MRCRLPTRVLVVGAAYCCLSRGAAAQTRWSHLVGKPGDDVQIYLDTTRVYAIGTGRLEVWVRFDYMTPQYRRDVDRAYVSVVGREAIDCRARAHSVRSVTLYDQSGSVVFSHDDGDLRYESEWEHTVPDSIGEAIVAEVCRRYRS